MSHPAFEDKVAIVTGASSGIGSAIAARFAREGCRVVLAARNEKRLESLAEKITQEGGDALTVRTDVSRYDSVAALVEKTIERFGAVDIMVNNAGNAVAKSLVESTPEEIDLQLDVNLRGVCYGCHAVIGHMIERGDGHLINIGSICSMNHYPNFAAYVGAKFGVLGFSRSLYEEVRPHGIRVNVLCPAAVNTEWSDLAGAELPWPREKRLQPDDLAEAAAFCLTVPKHVQIDNIVLWPICEPTV